MSCPVGPQGKDPEKHTDIQNPANAGDHPTGKDGGPQKGWVKCVCPVCRKAFRLEREQMHDRSRSSYPFCSNRCRMVDLGRWLNGDYRFSSPATAEPEDPEEDEPQDPARRERE